MMLYLTAFAGAAIAFLALNLSWIGVIAQGFYQRQMGGLMAQSFNMGAVLLFYAIYLSGLVYFAIGPALEAGSLTQALISGGLFGMICYATYDLTNLAVLKDYPARLAFVDIAAGTCVTATASVAGYLLATVVY